jgi:uncharacterized protein YodC (DUF2158 family)
MGNEAFNQGDVVQLKSGGPKMTVLKLWIEASSKKTMVHCAWFDKDAKEQEESFEPEALKSAD